VLLRKVEEWEGRYWRTEKGPRKKGNREKGRERGQHKKVEDLMKTRVDIKEGAD
jgi:hypothetical protein